METNMHHHPTAIGTICGFILSIWSIPSTASIQQTITLAIIGAIAGFFGTIVTREVWKWIKSKFSNK